MLKISYPSKISRVFVYPSLPSLRVRVQEGYKICTLTPTLHLPLLKPLTITNHSATHHMKVALWVARCHCPFAIIEDPELLDIFRDLNNKCTTPSASTVSRDIKEIFQLTPKKVAQMLQVHSLFPFSYLVLMTVRLTEANYISALMAGHHLKQYHFSGLPFTGSQVAMSLPSFWTS